jgi:serine protease Do
LQGGDVITAVNGNPVKSGNDLVDAITSAPLGSKMELTYIRDRKERKASVTIEAREQVFSGNSSTAESSPSEQSSPVKFGLHVAALSPERARELGIEGQRGVVVSEVDPGSFAEDIGFQQGDVIVEVNQKGVDSSGDLRQELGRLRAGGEVVFKVLRQDRDRGLLTMFLAGTAPA